AFELGVDRSARSVEVGDSPVAGGERLLCRSHGRHQSFTLAPHHATSGSAAMQSRVAMTSGRLMRHPVSVLRVPTDCDTVYLHADPRGPKPWQRSISATPT